MANQESSGLQLERGAGGMGVVYLDVPNKPLNVLGRQTMRELDSVLDQVSADRSLTLLVFLSRKASGFLAGADLNEFRSVESSDEAMALSSMGQGLFEKLANLRVPTVAVIHGACLGGGLELALACDYRVVVAARGTQLGLPEIKLGLIPGWGGTQRLPRTVGLERAFRVILQQHQLNAREALEWGLADVTVNTLEEALPVVERWIGKDVRARRKRRIHRLPLGTWRQRLLESTTVGRALLFRGVERILKRKVPDDMPGPWEALRAVRLGLSNGIAAGLAYEREAIGRLAKTTACRNLMTIFFLMDGARKGELSAGPAPEVRITHRPIRKVGVVGAGTMGAGIAQLALLKGYEVVIQEVNAGALASGMTRLEILVQKAVAKRVISAEDAAQRLTRMGKTIAWEGFSDVDLVIEAAVEDLDQKREVFRQLERVTPAEALLATNTSSLSVGEMQRSLTRPGRMAGLHFFNPVHKMPLVEVVRAPATQDQTIAALVQWASAVGKTPVVLRDSPGFIVNRILFPYLNEAGILVAQGMAVEEVDRVMRRFGMLMGPLELLDQVGLDVAAHAATSMRELFSGRITPHPALERMCARGWLGQKTGRGFYRYVGKSRAVDREAMSALQAELASDPVNNSIRAEIDADSTLARERMVCLTVNEAAACLSEVLAERAEIIDLAMVLGTAWAPHRGGPLRYADDRGVIDIVRTMENLRNRFGPRFEPCKELRERAASKRPFYGDINRVRAVS
jgi:3-hydroxyacyl-CoA dehydrogenase/enoyl-CoA hydratase/3-hydroxybutyryl-CoA epimerase